MKKSDMVKALLEYDDELMPLQAEDIINFLVSRGMLPPPIKRLEYSLTLNEETGEWEEGKISLTVNEWEWEE